MKDRTLKLTLALIAVALWAIVLRPLWTPSTAQAQEGKTGKTRYEYSILVDDNAEKMEDELDSEGAKGWRAAGFAVHPTGTFSSPQVIVLLERRLE